MYVCVPCADSGKPQWGGAQQLVLHPQGLQWAVLWEHHPFIDVFDVLPLGMPGGRGEEVNEVIILFRCGSRDDHRTGGSFLSLLVVGRSVSGQGSFPAQFLEEKM